MHIAKTNPNANLLVVQLAALLHDIADSKFHNGDETIGPKIARKFLEENKIDENIIEEVIKIIENISFKGVVKRGYNSQELDIVQDADRLDAIGAIGIARTFNYGGFKNRELYNPEVKPNLNMSKEEYKNSTADYQSFLRKIITFKRQDEHSKRQRVSRRKTSFYGNFFRAVLQRMECSINEKCHSI